ncbi:sigma-70 family RNA polymerase sigma factor [Amycolatopsis sp. NPDC051061]|uniref:sigma-70 family RNA polymerase sigma factor n=1 Tax=Amycolatopsis sp. NPDC051061 TaxID=3155042 RepID=UPI00343D1550
MLHTLECERTRDELLQTLLKQYEKPLLRYISNLASDRGVAEDILQETLIRTWKNAGILDLESESIWPWLYSVARNLMIDHVRWRRRHPEAAESAMTTPVQSDHVDRIIDNIIVWHALAQLPTVYLEILKRRYLLGLTINEVAEDLGLPAGTVKSRTHYAIEKLRDVLTIGQVLA